MVEVKWRKLKVISWSENALALWKEDAIIDLIYIKYEGKSCT